MVNRIPITDASLHLSDYVDQVAREGTPLLLVADGKPVAELGPTATTRTLAELPGILRSLPHLSPQEAEAFARDVAMLHSETARQTSAPTWE